MSGEPEPPPGAEDDDPAEPGLGRLARGGAGMLGLAALVGGGFGTFVSTNQVGTAALLVIGAGFALVALQNTPILKIGEKGVELTPRERAAKKTLKSRVNDALSEGKGDQAAALMAATKALDPNVSADPDTAAIERRIYWLQVVAAVDRVTGHRGVVREVGRDTGMAAGIDGHIVLAGEPAQMLALTVVRTDGEWLSADAVWAAAAEFGKAGLPGLVVANQNTTGTAVAQRPEQARDVPLRVVRWCDERDDDALRAALDGLLSSSSTLPAE